jgi:membrane protein EpsK
MVTATDVKQTSVISKESEALPDKSFRKQLLPNLISNMGVLILNILLGLLYTPYLIRSLGVAAYGLVPLANSLTAFLSLVKLSINNAAGRFLTLDIEKHDWLSANRTFNTLLLGNVGMMLVILPVVVGIVVLLPRWIDVPAGQEVHAQILFAMILAAYLMTLIQSSFSISVWARNRFDLRNLVIIVDHIARTGIVLILFSLTSPSLWHVGVGIVGAVLASFVADVFLWRLLTPHLHIEVAQFDSDHVRRLFGMGGWLFVTQLGSILILRTDLLLTNLLLGAEVAGEYGSVATFSTLLFQLATTAAAILTPTQLAKYAQDDLVAVNRISQCSVKFMGLALALPVGLLCGWAHPLLRLWLGPTFEHLAGLLVLLVFPLVMNLGIQPLFGLKVVLNKVQLPAVVTLVLGMLNIGLSMVLAQVGWGIFGVAFSGALTLTLNNVLFTSVYLASIQKLPWHTFLGTAFQGALAAICVGAVSWGIAQVVNLSSWLLMIGIGSMISALYAAGIYLRFLTPYEKQLLNSLLPVKSLSCNVTR